MFNTYPASKSSIGNRSLVLGVGINDANYVLNYKDDSGKIHRCPYYTTWLNMLSRCFNPRHWLDSPTYIGCTVADQWKVFSNFRSWMEQQDWKDRCLDKDIISWDAKHYGPDTCLFISRDLNNLLCLRRNALGEFPLGVTKRMRKHTPSYHARLKKYGKQVNLGCFDTVEEAAAKYKEAKLNYIAELANAEKDPRIKQALLNLF